MAQRNPPFSEENGGCGRCLLRERPDEAVSYPILAEGEHIDECCTVGDKGMNNCAVTGGRGKLPVAVSLAELVEI